MQFENNYDWISITKTKCNYNLTKVIVWRVGCYWCCCCECFFFLFIFCHYICFQLNQIDTESVRKKMEHMWNRKKKVTYSGTATNVMQRYKREKNKHKHNREPHENIDALQKDTTTIAAPTTTEKKKWMLIILKTCINYVLVCVQLSHDAWYT